MIHQKLLGLVATAALVSAPFAPAADWPQYRGPAWDGVSPEAIGTVAWPADGPRIVWKKPTALGFSSFAVADGRAFTLTAEPSAAGLVQTCVALDAATGERRWSYAMSASDYRRGGDAGARGNRGGDGPRSTPTVDGDRVYAYDSQLVIACLDAATGKPIWRRDVLSEFDGQNIAWSSAVCPVVAGDTVYLVGGGPGRAVIALDKQTGKTRWAAGSDQMTHATPMLATLSGRQQLVCFMQSGLVGYDPANGTELWRTAYPYNVSTAAMPVVVEDLVYCSAGYGVGAGLFRIVPQAGGPRMAVQDVWQKTNQLMNHWSTPVYHDGHLYGIYEHKKYGKAPLQCVELATGQIKWKQYGYGPGNVILVGDKLVALSDAGEVAIVAATPDSYRELARAKVLTGKCWSTPAYSKGRIYIRSTTEGACIEL